MINYKKIFFVILLCSSSSLAYEIALTRIFSITLWYHFAFMIISIAMLGIGASGTLLSLYSKLRDLSKVGVYSLLLGLWISFSYILSNWVPFDPVKLSWSKVQIFYIGIYYITLSIPFFFAGLIIATAFSLLSEKSGLLYGADLVGAGIGSISVLSIMIVSPPEKAVFLISSISLMASFIIGGKRLKTIALILISMNFFLSLYNPDFITTRMSPYKGLQTALKYPGAEHLKTYFSSYSRIDTFKSPVVRFAPGMSFRFLDALPPQIGFSIDGGDVSAITNARKQTSLNFIRYLPSALPYEITSPIGTADSSHEKSILILNPKGGLQVLIADYYGFLNVYKIENNPFLMEILKDDFNEFSGEIYSQNTWTGLGRSWLKHSDHLFNIIDIPMMSSSPSGTFGISEDYRFTIEAFKEYLHHLKPSGILSLNLFILPPPRIELRILLTAIKALDEFGIKDVEKHIAAIRSWGTLCILIKKSEFTLDEINTIKSFTKYLRFDLIYYPGISEEETNIYIRMPSNEYFTVFQNIIHPEKRDQFVQAYLFDIKPAHDENPFFHYYLKLKNIGEIYRIMGKKWQYFIEEGYILPLVFIQVLILSSVLIILPAFSKRYKNNPPLSPISKEGTGLLGNGLPLLPYFAFLGIGFMFIEVSLVQKMILPLENPSYAFATVLTSILISSGIGSLLSYKLRFLRNSAVPLAISFVTFIYAILLPLASDIISSHSFIYRIISLFFILIPLGLLMGIPFPTGLKILGERNETLIPWAWAINGCLSVLAPILTIMIALVFGFKIVLWLGSLSYLMAFIIMKHFLRK